MLEESELLNQELDGLMINIKDQKFFDEAIKKLYETLSISSYSEEVAFIENKFKTDPACRLIIYRCMRSPLSDEQIIQRAFPEYKKEIENDKL